MATSLLGLGLLAHAGTASAQSFPALPGIGKSNTPVTAPFPGIAPQPAPLPPPISFPVPSTDPKTPQVSRDSAPSMPVVQPNTPNQDLPGQAVQQNQNPQDKLGLKAGLEAMEFRGLREVPGLERLTLLETESDFKERMRQEAMKYGERIVFPEEPVLSKEPYEGRHWSPMLKQVEPAFVAHRRLYFEQQNFERGLWDLGILTPVLSGGKFFWDVVTLPYHCGTRPLQHYDASAGKCLPGDPSPFYLYPPELSLTGFAAQAAAIAGGIFIFP